MNAIKKTALADDVLAILSNGTIDGNVVRLPKQLDRPTYMRVNKALTSVGGKWNRKVGGHVFNFDPHELIGDAVATGSIVDIRRTLQFFETPDDLAQRMVALAGLACGDLVLEPSAGKGRIVRHLMATGATIEAVEIDANNCKALCDLAGAANAFMVCQNSFESYGSSTAERFEAIVMNPPFSDNRDISHIRLAWTLLHHRR